jgi:hypothetical protein
MKLQLVLLLLLWKSFGFKRQLYWRARNQNLSLRDNVGSGDERENLPADKVDSMDSYSLLSMANMIQEISSSKSARFRQSADKMQESFAKLFASRYNLAKDRLLQAVNVSARLDIIPSSSDGSFYLDKIVFQLQSVEKAPSSILFYNEPLANLDYMKFPFFFPVDTIAYSSKDIVALPAPIIEPQDSSKNLSKNLSLREKGQMLSMQSILNRLQSSTDSRRRSEEAEFFSRFKLGLRLESLKWRLGNKMFSYLFRDTEHMIEDLDDDPDRKANRTANPLQYEPNIDYKYENFTVDNLSHREANPTTMKIIGNKWRSALTALESITPVKPFSAKNAPPSDRDVNYPLLLHSALVMSLATYNLRLSSILTDYRPAIAQKLGQIVDDIFQMRESVDNINFSFINSVIDVYNREREGWDTNFSNEIKRAITTLLADASLKDQRKIESDMTRSVLLSRNALGSASYTNQQDLLIVHTIQADKACAILSYDKRSHLITIAFRGTKDPLDIITDITFAPKVYDSIVTKANVVNLKVHSGFLSSFESIVPQLDSMIASLLNSSSSKYTKPMMLLTGHSMGGAIAQLAAAYYADYNPYLITIAAPAIGNKAFCSYLERTALPCGGIRLWNEYDIVPFIALFVGYEHAGLPIKMKLSDAAKEYFRQEVDLSNPLFEQYPTSLDVFSPHILYQIGSIMYVFPILGVEFGKE